MTKEIENLIKKIAIKDIQIEILSLKEDNVAIDEASILKILEKLENHYSTNH